MNQILNNFNSKKKRDNAMLLCIDNALCRV